jgi:hypothetical protein
MKHGFKWPHGKSCGVVFSVDDIHPGTSKDAYEAGGDLECGALGKVDWLLQQHQELRATLFATADWREISPVPTNVLRFIPKLRDHFYLTPILPKGTMAFDRHPQLVSYLKSQPRFEIALHGLHHVHKGLTIPVEFQDEPVEEMADTISLSLDIFRKSGLNFKMGFQPPAWNTPLALVQACKQQGILWMNAARDVTTTPSSDALTNMSGPKGHSLLFPDRFENGIIHFPSNFQATSPVSRALKILESGGLLSVKAHIIKKK